MVIAKMIKKSKNKVHKLARQLKNINYTDGNLNKIGNIGGKIMGEMIKMLLYSNDKKLKKKKKKISDIF